MPWLAGGKAPGTGWSSRAVANLLASTAELEQKRMGHTALDCVFLQDYLLTAKYNHNQSHLFPSFRSVEKRLHSLQSKKPHVVR